NEQASSYAQEMQHALESMSEGLRRASQVESGRDHVFVLRRDLMDEGTFDAIISAARIVLHARNGKLIDQINRAVSLFSTPADAATYRRPLVSADDPVTASGAALGE